MDNTYTLHGMASPPALTTVTERQPDGRVQPQPVHLQLGEPDVRPELPAAQESAERLDDAAADDAPLLDEPLKHFQGADPHRPALTGRPLLLSPPKDETVRESLALT